MSLQVLDPKTSASVTRLKQDVDSPGYRTFLLRNVSSDDLTALVVKIADAEIGSGDATYLANRSVISMAYTRAGTPTTSFLGVSPLAVLAKVPADWEGILLDGWLQVSEDTFTWYGKITVGTIAANAEQQIYVRYSRPTFAATIDLSFTLTNLSAVTMSSIVLTAAGTDLLSLDDIAYTASVTVGTLTAGASKTIYLRSASIDTSKLNPGEIEILTGSDADNPLTVQFDAIGLDRFYTTVEEVSAYVKTIDTTDITSDEELRDFIKEASRQIDRATRRTFVITRIVEHYDGSGQAKLVLENYPLISLNELQILNYNSVVISDIKPTDTDFATRVTVDYEYGYITLNQAGVALAPVPIASNFYWPYSSYLGAASVRAADFDYAYHFGKGYSNIIVDYTYGYQVPPEPIRRAAMKMVVIEILRKRGASDSQGVASESIAGATFTYGTRSAQGGSGPYGHTIAELQADVDAVIKQYAAKRLKVV
jgi:hypothetical protein